MPKKPKNKQPLAHFAVNLFESGVPTRNGRIYDAETISRIGNQINTTPTVIEEVSPIERSIKNIPISEVWLDHAMAISTGATMQDGKLLVEFDVLPNRYGKLLMSTIESVGGIENMNFAPVGCGDVDSNGVVKGYTYSYVSFNVTNREPS